MRVKDRWFTCAVGCVLSCASVEPRAPESAPVVAEPAAPAVAAAETAPPTPPVLAPSSKAGEDSPPPANSNARSEYASTPSPAPARDASAPPPAPLEEGLSIPRDWQRVSIDGVSVPMPLGIERREDGENLELVAQDGDATYSLRVLPAPAQPITQNNVTAATLRLLGRCTKSLRVSDVIERAAFFASNFSSACPDGSRRQGRLIVSGDSLFVLSIASPRSADVVTEPFLYGFEPAR